MGKLIFNCGCKFDVDGLSDDIYADYHDGPLPIGINVDIYNIPHNCSRTWDLISRGMTKGVFQLEGHLGKTWATKIKPQSVEDLAALVSLIRPGCLRALSGDPPKSMTQRYCDRKNRLEDVLYYHPSLEDIMGTTYGVLCYQEQSMKISVALAGFDLQQADILRKAIGKKKADIMAKIKTDFLSGCEATEVVSREQAEEIFGWIQESQRYSFNKSHAVSYGEGGYWTAYLKAHFPVQFYCAYLHGSQWKQDTSEEVYELINDSKLNNVTISVPDLCDKKSIPYIKNNDVYFGLSDIKQIGQAALNKIIENIDNTEQILDKKITEWSWMDYLCGFSDTISTTANEAIISAGCLSFIGKDRSEMLYEFELWNNLTDKEKEWIKNGGFDNLNTALATCAKTKKEGGGCHGAKRATKVGDLSKLLNNPPHSLEDTADFIAWCESKYLGASITCSKVDGCEKSVEANSTCKEIIHGKTGYTVIAVEIIRAKEITTKKGKTPGRKMAFLSVSDSSCAIDDVVAFPETWKEYGNLLYEGNTVLIQGEKASKNKNSFIIRKVWQI